MRGRFISSVPIYEKISGIQLYCFQRARIFSFILFFFVLAAHSEMYEILPKLPLQVKIYYEKTLSEMKGKKCTGEVLLAFFSICFAVP